MVGLTKAPHPDHHWKTNGMHCLFQMSKALETTDCYVGRALRLLTTHQLATTLSAPPSLSLPDELLSAFLLDISGSTMH